MQCPNLLRIVLARQGNLLTVSARNPIFTICRLNDLRLHRSLQVSQMNFEP